MWESAAVDNRIQSTAVTTCSLLRTKRASNFKKRGSKDFKGTARSKSIIADTEESLGLGGYGYTVC